MTPFSEAKETFNIEGQKDFQVMSFENLGSQDNIERDENDNDEIVEDLTEEEIINEMAEQLKFLYTKAATVNKQGEIIKVDIDKVEAEYGSPEPNNQEAMIASDFLTSDHRKTPNLNNIQILNFHHWIKKDHGISELEIDDYIEKIENDALTPVKYDAILIDEGQDFEGSWLHLISLCLDQETQSLLLVEDRAQDIYRKSRSYVKDTGLDFRGRSRILNINYRNTSQIVDFGWKFYDSHRALDLKLKQEQTETIEIIPPKKTKRKGPEVELLRWNTFKEEIEEITKQIVDQHNEKNIPYSEMAILYRIKGYNNHYISAIQSEFQTKNIPYNWITENGATKHKFNPEEETVKICSLDSSKGLDFHSVFIVKADLMPLKYEEDQEKEVSLMYIGMTRAKEYLSISYSGVSSFTQYFEDAKQKEPTFNQ